MPHVCLPYSGCSAVIVLFRSSDYVTTNLTKLNTILSIQEKKHFRTQGREQLAGKKGPWILIPGLPSGIDLGQLIYFLPWRLFLESQGVNKNRLVSSESEMICLDSQSQCHSQAKPEYTGLLSSQRFCLLFREVSSVFLCHHLTLIPELPRASLLHKHGCTSHTVKKLFGQRIRAALFLYPSKRFPDSLLVASKLAAHSSNTQQWVRPYSYKGPSRSPYLICKQNQSLAFESQRKLCLLSWWLVLRRSLPGVELLLWPWTLSGV